MKPDTESIWKACCCELKNFILRRTQDNSLADDILQEVFIKIHEKIDTLKDSSKICSWVFQIARNTIIDYHRKNKIKFQDIDTIPEEIFGNTDEVYDKTERDPALEITTGLRAMIEALPEKYSEALLLVEFQGISQIDLAKTLKISPSGAKSRVQRARQLLKDNLMNCCHYEFDKYGTVIGVHPISCCCCHLHDKN